MNRTSVVSYKHLINQACELAQDADALLQGAFSGAQEVGKLTRFVPSER
jgi:hypothetical protein